jgi:hypothetical protein
LARSYAGLPPINELAATLLPELQRKSERLAPEIRKIEDEMEDFCLAHPDYLVWPNYGSYLELERKLRRVVQQKGKYDAEIAQRETKTPTPEPIPPMAEQQGQEPVNSDRLQGEQDSTKKPDEDHSIQDQPSGTPNTDHPRFLKPLIFPCPSSTTWEWKQITVTLLPDEIVRIKTPLGEGRFTYHNLGFTNRTKGNNPIAIWETLKLFCKFEGAMMLNS